MIVTFKMYLYVIYFSRAENDAAVVQPSHSGSLAERCVLVLYASCRLGWLCSRSYWSHMHNQLEAE